MKPMAWDDYRQGWGGGILGRLAGPHFHHLHVEGREITGGAEQNTPHHAGARVPVHKFGDHQREHDGPQQLAPRLATAGQCQHQA